MNQPSSPVSVSYTHLRAHETVLDLVCRLLLEKKKYQTTQTSQCYIISTLHSHHHPYIRAQLPTSLVILDHNI